MSQRHKTYLNIPEFDGNIYLGMRKKKGHIFCEIKGFGVESKKLKEIAKEIKKRANVGGNIKDFTIIIQGNKITEIQSILNELGYLKVVIK